MRENRQADHLAGYLECIAEPLGLCAVEPAVHGKLRDQRIEVAAGEYSRVAQTQEQDIAGNREALIVHEQGAIGIVPVQPRRGRNQTQARNAIESLAITLEQLPASCQGAIQMLELEEAEGGLHLVHLAVDAGGDHRHLVSEAEVLQVIDALLDLRIRADDGSALEGVEHLRCVKAQDRQVPAAQDADAILTHAERVGGVIDDLETVGVGHSLNPFHIAGNAVAVHGHDRGGGRCDGFLDPCGVQIAGNRIDIDEHGLETVPQHRVRGRHEGIRGGDHLAGDPQGLEGRHQGKRAVGEQADMLDPQVVGQLPLEALVHGTAIRQAAAFPHGFQIGKKIFKRR
ncbi:hypothetical protein D9M69_332690 [compost metagenome]